MIITFLCNILITWRLTSLAVSEEGPFDVFARLRDLIGIEYDEFNVCIGTNIFAKAFCCFWCASLWISTLVVLSTVPWSHPTGEILGQILSYSAGAIIVQKYVQR